MRLRDCFATGAVFLLLNNAGAKAPPQAAVPEHDPHTLIVKLAPHVDGMAAARGGIAKAPLLTELQAAGIDSISPLFPVPPKGVQNPQLYDSLQMGQFFVSYCAEDRDIGEIRANLGHLTLIESSEFNVKSGFTDGAVVPNDPFYAQQWHYARIDLPQAWNMMTGSSAVVIGVIDSGIDYLHPDLDERIAVNLTEYNGVGGIDDDFNGLIDDIAGYDFVNLDNNPYDDQGHGTHVAATIGAETNNGVGVSGVTWSSWLYPVKVGDGGGVILDSWLLPGIYYAANMGCDILNLSLEGPFTVPKAIAIEYAYSSGCVLIAASGNSNLPEVSYPAWSVYTLAVGATNVLDQRWISLPTLGSNYGIYLDVVAPGDDIYSCFPLWHASAPYGSNTGTSMAAPHASGLAALILATRPGLPVESVYSYIRLGSEDHIGNSAEDWPGWDPYYGWGRINAYRSLLLATGQLTCDCPFQGDIDGNRFGDATDLAFLIDITFLGGTDYRSPLCPVWRSDFDNNGFTDATDLAFWIDFTFFGGAGPDDPCP